jgi:malonyl-CoA decarboxylase
LTGIELGSFLIKRVVGELKSKYPNLDTFCTLSPIPGFRRWLEQQPDAVLLECIPHHLVEPLCTASQQADVASAIQTLTLKDDWIYDARLIQLLHEPLDRLCARYLFQEKRTNNLALDPVANFHLRNGASVHRLNFLSDTSIKGLRESYGIMVNYNYLLEHVEENNQRYVMDGEIAFARRDSLFEQATRGQNVRWHG